MFDIDKWQEILHTIRKNKLRTFLTAFSVAWGIFILMILLGFGTGFHKGVEYQFRDVATNSIWVSNGETSMPYKGMKPGKRIWFTNQDFEDIAHKVDGVEYAAARYYCWGEFIIRYKDRYSSFEVFGANPHHQYIENQTPVKGRFINELDMKERRKVCVIGIDVVPVLFGADEDPLDKWIDVRGIKYKVVGTFDDAGGEGELKRIFIPLSTAQLAYNEPTRVHQIMFTTGDASIAESEAMVSQVKMLLSQNHVFHPDDPRAVRVWNNVEQFQKFSNLFKWIKIFLSVVGSMTIIAGIVGVSNIMLIVVKERTREIGVRKALGATPGSIIGLFLQESVAITLVAGYIGLLFGIGLIELINWAMVEFNAQPEFFRNPEVNIQTAITATLVLVLAGAIAGFFPARKAANVQPIVALRDE